MLTQDGKNASPEFRAG